MLKPSPSSPSAVTISDNGQSALEKEAQLDEYVSERVYK